MNKDARMKLKVLMIGVLALMTLVGTAAYGKDTMKVKLGQQYFEIPKQNVLDSSEPFWLRFIPGLRPSRDGILLVMGAEEIAANVKGYRAFDGKYEAKIFLQLEVLASGEAQKMLDPNMHVYSDAWYGKGRFEKRIIEHDQESGFYKISNEAGHGVFWTALRAYPGENQPIPENPFDFYVASCVDSTSPLTSTGQLADCSVRTVHVHGDLYLDFNIAGFNLKLVDDVKAFLVKRLLEWKVTE